MKRLAFPSAISPALALALALAAGSCADRQPVESPTLPAPPPPASPAPAPESMTPAPAPPPKAAPPQKVERPPGLLSKPSFTVAMVEKTGEGRKVAADQSVKAVTLLVMSGYQAHTARPPADLPPARIEAAQKSAAAAQGPHTGQIFLFGEITRGPTTEVKVTAIEPRDGRIIEDKGYRSSTEPVEKILEKTIGALLPTIETYWRLRN